jgi:hypothetical protein
MEQHELTKRFTTPFGFLSFFAFRVNAKGAKGAKDLKSPDAVLGIARTSREETHVGILLARNRAV